MKNDLVALLNATIDKTPLLSTPMHVFWGKQDKFVSKNLIMNWSRYGQRFQFMPIEGGHMFMLSNTVELVEKIISQSLYYKSE